MHQIVIEPDSYESRTYPFGESEIATWLDELPPDHVKGLTVIVTDAKYPGNGGKPLHSAGQYLTSRQKRIMSDNPEGVIKLFTLRVRYLKRGPVYTNIFKQDFRSWESEDMDLLLAYCRWILRHEVGHYVIARTMDAPGGRAEEMLADSYSNAPLLWDIESRRGVR